MKTLYTFVVISASFILGHLLPKRDIAGDVINVVNLPWGTLYGIGWWSAGMVFGLGTTPAAIIGFVLWPIFVMVSLGYIASLVYRRGRFAIAGSFIVLIITASINISPEQAENEPYSRFPLFWNYFSSH